MSPRTIGGTGGYYENLVTPRALFSPRHRGKAPRGEEQSGLPAHIFDASAGGLPAPCHRALRLQPSRRPSLPIRRSDGAPCPFFVSGGLRGPPPLAVKVGQQR